MTCEYAPASDQEEASSSASQSPRRSDSDSPDSQSSVVANPGPNFVRGLSAAPPLPYTGPPPSGRRSGGSRYPAPNWDHAAYLNIPLPFPAPPPLNAGYSPRTATAIPPQMTGQFWNVSPSDLSLRRSLTPTSGFFNRPTLPNAGNDNQAVPGLEVQAAHARQGLSIRENPLQHSTSRDPDAANPTDYEMHFEPMYPSFTWPPGPNS
jgi:hypothetical protein